MREILFRGKIKEDVCPANIGKWVDGELSKDYDDDCQERYWIGDCRQAWIVEEETIGQYTGLDDRNGIKIFEGDIVRIHKPKTTPHLGIVEWDKRSASFVVRTKAHGKGCKRGHMKVVGNVFDNDFGDLEQVVEEEMGI